MVYKRQHITYHLCGSVQAPLLAAGHVTGSLHYNSPKSLASTARSIPVSVPGCVPGDEKEKLQ